MRDVMGVLREALAIEQAGEDFYRRAAETCDNPVAHETFVALAQVEQEHANYFRAVYDAMAQTGKWPAADAVELAHHEVPAMAKTIFDQARCDAEECAVVMCAELHQLYEAAMDKERASIRLYETQATESDNPDEQTFYSFLVGQERGHLELLANTQKFLDDPSHWFFDQEQWIVEG
jgi:rubrerythrin